MSDSQPVRRVTAGLGTGNMTFIPKPGGEHMGLSSGLHRLAKATR